MIFNMTRHSGVDVSKDTVTPETLLEGYTAYNSKGELITGLMKPVPVDEPTMYLYGQKVLPALPNWDKETHPYAVIYEYSILGMGYYYAILSPVPLAPHDTDNTKFTVDTSAVVYRISSSYYAGKEEEWIDSTLKSGSYNTLRWANHDVHKADGTLVLAGSEARGYYGSVVLFDGEVTVTRQTDGDPANLSYQFVGLDLKETDYKVVDVTYVIYTAEYKGVGNLGNSAVRESMVDEDLLAKDWFYFYFDEQGVPWIVANCRSEETETDVVEIKIVKYILG